MLTSSRQARRIKSDSPSNRSRTRRLFLESLEDRRLLVTLASLSDFEDGTTQGWLEGGPSPNPPTNQSSGGPGGASDNYLRNVATGGGGPGGRWLMFNTNSTWTGNYVSVGVTRIDVQMANFGSAPVPILMAIGTANVRFGGNWYASNPVTVPADGAWRSYSFDLDAGSLTQVQGNASLSTVLSTAGALRFLANPGLSHIGSAALGPITMGFDNIRAGAANAAPSISLPGGEVNYTATHPPVIIDAAATATDADSANLDTGSLIVELTANGTTDDRLEIRNEGTGTGQIGVSGSNVSFGGTTIGTFSGGMGTAPLVVALNANSSPAAAQALMRNISYQNASASASTSPRTVQFTLTDGDGGTSNAETETINVALPPTVTLAVDNSTIAEQSRFVLMGNAGVGLLAGNENPAAAGGSGGLGFSGIALDTDTNLLSIDVRWGSGNGFTDLSGNATMMHIHGPTDDPTPAGFSQNTGVLVGLDGLPGFNGSATNGGFLGTVVLTDDQEAAILANRTYLNVHTAANTGGEIRGNLVSTSLSTLTATLSAATTLPVSVDLGFTGTATSGTDYVPSSAQITIAAGDTTGTATVLAVDDMLDESDETVIVDVTSVANALETGTQQQTITILDNDPPPNVTAHEINGTGNNNRSDIAGLLLQFDQAVTVDGASALNLFNHTTGAAVDISTAPLQNNGSAEISWNLAALNLPDGFYTAELPRRSVLSADGLPMYVTHTITFHKLAGDSSGNAQVDLTDFIELNNNFNTLGGPILGPGDLDGNGNVDLGDFILLNNTFNNILTAVPMDLGDAPESGSYPTTLANNGARHLLGSGLVLGSAIDAETNGQPDGTATGDDNAGDDEDGVTFGTLQAGTNGTVTITAGIPSGTGVLNAWMDFNADGDWDDAGEKVFVDQALVNGTNNLTLAVPSGAVAGTTFARFRVTSEGGYSYFGLAPDGEVEDYQVTLVTARSSAARQGPAAVFQIWTGVLNDASETPPSTATAEPTERDASTWSRTKPIRSEVVDRFLKDAEPADWGRGRAASNPLAEDPQGRLYEEIADLLLADDRWAGPVGVS